MHDVVGMVGLRRWSSSECGSSTTIGMREAAIVARLGGHPHFVRFIFPLCSAAKVPTLL